MEQLQQVSLKDCTYYKDTGVLTLASNFISGGFPEFIKVVSHRTGGSIVFEQDIEAAIANEFWDGEMCEYKPHSDNNRVSKLVVYNG